MLRRKKLGKITHARDPLVSIKKERKRERERREAMCLEKLIDEAIVSVLSTELYFIFAIQIVGHSCIIIYGYNYSNI